MKRFLLICTLLSLAQFALAQQIFTTPIATDGNGKPYPQLVTVCLINPGSGTCPTQNLATLYTDPTLQYQCTGTGAALNNLASIGAGAGCSNPGYADNSGNIIAFSNTGNAWCQISGKGIVPHSILCAVPGEAMQDSAGDFVKMNPGTQSLLISDAAGDNCLFESGILCTDLLGDTFTLPGPGGLGVGSAFSSSLPFVGTQCSNGASPAVCGASVQGSVAIPTGVNPTLVVDTSIAVTTAQIFLTVDESATISGVTCNTTAATVALMPYITARTNATSFTIGVTGTVSTNPLCVNFTIQ